MGKSSEQIAKNIARRAAANKKVKEGIYEILEEKAPRHRDEILEYILERLDKEGDAFTRITGVGQFNEAVIATYLGVLDSKEDVLKFRVFNNTPYWKGGDISIPQKNRDNVEMQVKGNDGVFSIPWQTELVLNDYGRIAEGANKKKNLLKCFHAYIKNSPNNIRIGVPVYHTATKGFFDFGATTFISLVHMAPDLFTFVNPTEFKIFTKTTAEVIADIKGGRASILFGENRPKVKAQLETLLKIELDNAEDSLDEYIELIIEDLRKSLLYRYAKIRFSYLGAASKIAILVNPLINTGIGKEDNKDPFYELLKDLFKGGFKHNMDTYMSENYTTHSNKLPENYYNHNYVDLNY